MQPEVKEADFEVGPHEPEWLVVGSVRVCLRCGLMFPGGEDS